MGIPKPDGPYAEQLLEPGGWTDADEDQLYKVAHEATQAVQQLTFRALDPWQRERSETFDGGSWLGRAAGAANNKAGKHSDEFAAQQNNLVKVVEWNKQVAELVKHAKEAIADNVDEAQKKIEEVKNLTIFGPLIDAFIQAIAINHIISTYHARNVSEVSNTASAIPAADALNPPPNALQSLLDQKQAPPALPPAPSTPVSNLIANPPTAGSGGAPFTKTGTPEQALGTNPIDRTPANPPPGATNLGGLPPTATQAPRPAGTPASPMSTTSGTTATPSAGTPSGTPASTAAASGAPTATPPVQPAGAGPAADAAAAKAPVAPPMQSSPMSSAPMSAPPVADPHPATPAAASTSTGPAASTASGPATAPPVSAPSTGGGATGSGMGGGMGGGMPLGAPPTAPPAAPVPPAAAAAAPPPAAAAAPPQGGAQVAPVPVSAARAERDAAQNAARRNAGEHDPLSVARRIAAALNAPDMVNVDDFFFHWITAVTKDGKIVVANNYGLAYIPEQVQLPQQVVMASADESISPAERGSWATFPIIAIQRWAQHHDKELRAVIGTEEQFAGTDAGAHQVILTPEDIPASGKMTGRDRLQVIAPEISARLAGFSDADLVSVLPPAPADSNPPEDQRAELWDRVWQPLCSSASNRGQAHLQAFVAYAAHAQEHAFYAAHSAAEPQDQRKAADAFIYWQHVGQTIADALAT